MILCNPDGFERRPFFIGRFQNSRATAAKTIHDAIPIAVGTAAAIAVHFRLPVSFLIVRRVVEQGQWNSENNTVHAAVIQLQPFSASRLRTLSNPSMPARLP